MLEALRQQVLEANLDLDNETPNRQLDLVKALLA